jgi:tRNA-specific 2-thiouridylase
MSGGVDSSVAAALLVTAGHDVVGATMKLWGGPSDSGCCSVADVEDARRVAQQLGIAHHVFNFTEDFDRSVVEPYVAEHRTGRTPNPCIECNRHLKFDRFLDRAGQLGFDAIATGHYARVRFDETAGSWHLLRGADPLKDQSFVLYMLGQRELARVLLPVGELSKADVRARATSLGLRTAAKPDSQDVCFVSRSGGRRAFLAPRMPLTPGRMIDVGSGQDVGTVEAVELVTVGQRRGLSPSGASARRYALAVDVGAGTVLVGSDADLRVTDVALRQCTWVAGPPGSDVALEAQVGAHGSPVAACWDASASRVLFAQPQRRVAPGQSVVLYDGLSVVGGGIAIGDSASRVATDGNGLATGP